MGCRPSDRALEHLTQPFGPSGMTGVVLGLNAVPDVLLLNDCSACAPVRGEIIHGTHDWTSTVLSPSGRHRVAHTGLSPDRAVLDRRDDIVRLLRLLGAHAGTSMIVIVPAPTASMVAVDYRPLIDAVRDTVTIPILPLRLPSCTSDLMAGYEAFADLVAANLALPDDAPASPDKVAVVGYLWDRGEADHAATVAELNRLIRGLGLEPLPTWLSGTPLAGLRRVAEAGVIVSLPYGRQVARTLASRTGARVVETDLPVGLGGTSRWLRLLGEATGRREQAERFLHAEMTRWVPRMSLAADRHILGREFLVGLDTPLGTAVTGMLHEFGGRVRLLAVSGGERPDASCPAEAVLWNPPNGEVVRRVAGMGESADEDPVILGNQQMIRDSGTMAARSVPLGFPSPGTHHLFDAPFLGFTGTASLLDRIVDARVRGAWFPGA